MLFVFSPYLSVWIPYPVKLHNGPWIFLLHPTMALMLALAMTMAMVSACHSPPSQLLARSPFLGSLHSIVPFPLPLIIDIQQMPERVYVCR